MTGRVMHLNVNAAAAGVHAGSWRWPDADPYAFYDPAHYARIAQLAERGRLDAVFLADNSFLRSETYPTFSLDPLVIVAAMAAATRHVGLIASVSTTFHHPYTIARALTSLDHLSGGRVGWNVVTTRNRPAGHNYGFEELPDRVTRYARAAEAVEVALALWDSWEPGALVGDVDGGVLVDPTRIRPIDHVGEHFRVAGPLQVPPSPQGRPLLAQAGGSAGGIALAARFADAVFTSQPAIAEARAFRDRLSAAVRSEGRDPDAVAVLPGVSLVLGATEEDARRRLRDLNDLAPSTDRVAAFAAWVGVDASDLRHDQPFPLHLLPTSDPTYGSVGFDATTRSYLTANRELTVGDLIERGPFGHWRLVGTPEQVADELEVWFTTGAADGFILLCDSYPSGLEDFVDHVVPILQARGLARREYEADTLRGHYGLAGSD